MGMVDTGLEFLEESFAAGADDESCRRRVMAEDEVDEICA